MTDIRDILLNKIKNLSENIWERRASEPEIDEWLANFETHSSGTAVQRKLNALYLLSQFMYFGSREMRELMRVLFRDLYKYPIIEAIRKSHKGTTDLNLINREFRRALSNTLFLGIGNPSESGSHLLYYFRQENGLPKKNFVHTREIFERQPISYTKIVAALIRNRKSKYAGILTLRRPEIARYVFIDDFCGSGHQGRQYSKNVVEDIKSFNPEIEVSYFVLCGTTKGMDALKANTQFDVVKCVFELDESFRCFSLSNRYFPSPWPNDVTLHIAEQMCSFYWKCIEPDAPLGYGDCQLLLGFSHNIPDNTLPVFWSHKSCPIRWRPIFKRYPKIYG